MSFKQRKVSFYKLILEKRIAGNSTTLNNEQNEEYFHILYGKMKPLESGNKAIEVSVGEIPYVIEVISYDLHQVFAKIGRQNSADTVALRDQATLETEDVPMRESQSLELYTYFLLDFATGILSYIGIGGVPKISAIRSLFDNNLSEYSISSRIVSIMTHDILNTVVRKKTISRFEVSVAIPNDSILSDHIGISKEHFDDIYNVKDRTVTFKITSCRNKSFFHNSTKLRDLVTSFIDKFGNQLTAISVNAKDDGEKSQTYNILEYCFTKTVPLGQNDQSILTENDYYLALFNTYNSNRDELCQYIRP